MLETRSLSFLGFGLFGGHVTVNYCSRGEMPDITTFARLTMMDRKVVVLVALALCAAVHLRFGSPLLRMTGGSLAKTSPTTPLRGVNTTAHTPSSSEAHPRKRIFLLGERHSGTKWITSELRRCFQDGPGIEVSNHLTRWKHWFQSNDTRYNGQFVNAVVVVQVRNVYDWVHGMWQYPHHSSAHFGLDWKTFVTKPWTLPDAPALTPEDLNATKPPCVLDNWPHQVVPCHDLQDRGVLVYYEQNPQSGSVYPSLVDMRRDKLLHHLSMDRFLNISELIVVRLEDMEEDTGLLLAQIEQALGVEAQCEPTRQQQKPAAPLDEELVEWITEHVDWKVERLLGYTPRHPKRTKWSLFRRWGSG